MSLELWTEMSTHGHLSDHQHLLLQPVLVQHFIHGDHKFPAPQEVQHFGGISLLILPFPFSPGYNQSKSQSQLIKGDKPEQPLPNTKLDFHSLIPNLARQSLSVSAMRFSMD